MPCRENKALLALIFIRCMGALSANKKGRRMNFMLTSCFGAQSRNRTNDTGIFSPLLYRLSYLGLKRDRLA